MPPGLLPGSWLLLSVVLILLAAGIGGPHSASAFADPTATVRPWLTEDQARKAGAISLAWADTELRAGLRTVAETQRLAILLDRRIDPQQRLDLKLVNVPLLTALDRIATQTHSAATLLGPLCYLGPESMVRQLRTLAALRRQDAARLPARRKTAALRVVEFGWDDLATPREILQRLADEARFEIRGQELVPHDLWAATRLPPLAWVERVTVVAAQLGLTFAFDQDGGSITLVPIGDMVAIERSYPAGTDPAAMRESWQKRAPDARIQVAGNRLIVRGRIEDHERLSAAQRRPPVAGGRGGKQVHTVSVSEVALDSFLTQLEERLGIKFVIDREALATAGVSLNQAITVEVEGATTDELLAATFNPLGLAFKRQDKTVNVTAKPR